jgi:hypothetical protein
MAEQQLLQQMHAMAEELQRLRNQQAALPDFQVMADEIQRLRTAQAQTAQELNEARVQQPPAQVQPNQAPPRIKPPQPEPFGATTGQNVRMWIRDMDSYFQLTATNEEDDKIQMAQLLFRGNVRLWWHQHLERPEVLGAVDTWDDLKTLLTRHFVDANVLQRAQNKLANLRQTHSAHAYVTAFRSVAYEIPDMSEREKIDRFIRGLKTELARDVLRGRPETFNDAAKIAEDMDMLYHSAPAFFNRSRSSAGQQGPIPMEIDAVQGRRLTDAERASLRKAGACFYCREAGHMAKDCPRKRRQVNAVQIDSTTEESEN